MVLESLLKTRYSILPAGCPGVPPRYKKFPEIGGYRWLLETILAFSKRTELELGYNTEVDLTLEKEVQDTSCWGSVGAPQINKNPSKIGDFGS